MWYGDGLGRRKETWGRGPLLVRGKYRKGVSRGRIAKILPKLRKG